jgi:cytidyltransferase-like protein
MKIIIVSGGFDPLHSGHIEYFKAARELGDKLIVAVNSDAWLERKKGRAFLPCHERISIIENLKMVDGVILFNDNDDTAIEAIKNVRRLYPNDEIIFANGGDRNSTNIPEMLSTDVIFKFGVGGENKKNSSSWILQEWKSPKTERSWGYYRVLYDVDGTKVKELVVNPRSSLSMQRHDFRAEYWHVVEGCAVVNTNTFRITSVEPVETTLFTHQSIHINQGKWHQLTNPFASPCKVIEIQYGEKCIEEDIERS